MTAAVADLLDAALIRHPLDDPGRDTPAAVLFTTIHLDAGHGPVRAARLTATAHGVYEATLDGHPVTESVLNPGWTSYEWRLPAHTFDVTALIADGADLVFTVGNGWWRGKFGFKGAEADYGSDTGVVAALTIEYADGHVQRVLTDASWLATTGKVRANNLYDGQHVDFTHDPEPTRPVALGTWEPATLVPAAGPLITRHETLTPVAITTSPAGATLVDFGQNLVGWLRFRVRGERGATITLRHAEVLEGGELGVRPLRSARQTDTLTLSGGEDAFEPTFTFHGFRYVELAGWPGTPTLADLQAVVVHSDLRPTSTFASSHAGLNQLVHNSIWGQKGNFLGVPTDCPQRDERLGWTGDIAAYAATACFQFDSADFLHGWLLDVRAETESEGSVPLVVPNVLRHDRAGSWNGFPGIQAVWADAACWVPEAVWQAYGDRDRLAAHYPGMVAHLTSVEAVLSPKGLWEADQRLGDWLDPDAPADEPARAKADPGVVATASLYRSASFAARAADILGLDADARRWPTLADRTRDAFVEHYVDAAGRVRSDCATVYALAIAFGLLDAAARVRAGARLAELVRAANYRVSTGFAGTPYVTWALSETGHVEDAYRLLLEEGCPSWLYPITMGATTIWERWDSMLPDGSINPGQMTSFNHYALGAVADWISQVVGGIRAAEPGYARVRIEPVPGPGLDWADVSLDAPVGVIRSGWKRLPDGSVEVTAEIPDGVGADLVLPDGRAFAVVGGRHRHVVTC